MSDSGDRELREAQERKRELQEESSARMKKLHATAEYQRKVQQAIARRRVVKLMAQIEKMQDQMLQMQIDLITAKKESGQ